MRDRETDEGGSMPQYISGGQRLILCVNLHLLLCLNQGLLHSPFSLSIVYPILVDLPAAWAPPPASTSHLTAGVPGLQKLTL